jgi:hypothetical protein
MHSKTDSPITNGTPTPTKRYPDWVRESLKGWYNLALFAVAALFGDIVIMSLSTSPSNYLNAINWQTHRLFNAITTHPLIATVVSAVLLAATLGGYLAHRQAERKERTYEAWLKDNVQVDRKPAEAKPKRSTVFIAISVIVCGLIAGVYFYYLRAGGWPYQAKSLVRSSPTVANGIVYVGSDDGNLYAIDATSGLFK